MNDARPAPDCGSCRHFYVTWVANHPRGCRAYGFRSRSWPSAVVLRESGAPCALYDRRVPIRDEPPPGGRER